MTTDPVNPLASAPISQSPTKSPPALDHSPVRPVSPFKAFIPDLPPSVSIESGSPANPSSHTPFKDLQSPIKELTSPNKSVPDLPVKPPLSPVKPMTELFVPTEEVPPSESTVTAMAAAGEEPSIVTDLVKTPSKRGRGSSNGTTPYRKRSAGGSVSATLVRKSISASSLVRADSFAVGDLVFAHVKGHPWWPARLLEEKDVPEKFLKERRTPKERCIMFYNSDQYGFLTDEYLVPFAPNVDALATNASVKRAIKEAEDNPEAIFERIENIKKMSTEDEIEYDDDDEYDGDHPTTSTKSRKSSADKKTTTPKSAKRRTVDDEDSKVSKRSKTESTPSRTSKRKAGIAAPLPSEGATDMLMRWRHVLQKTFIKDKSIGDKPRISPETIHTVDFDNIKLVLDEFYDYMMGPNYNSEDVAKTKLHKVVRLIDGSSAMTDLDSLLIEHDIPSRIIRLMDALRFRSETSETMEAEQ